MISSQKQKVQIDDLRIDTIRTPNDLSKDQYHALLPRFLIENIDLKKLYYDRVLEAGNVKFYAPTIVIDKSFKTKKLTEELYEEDFIALQPYYERPFDETL